jgi:hypothetical protein
MYCSEFVREIFLINFASFHSFNNLILAITQCPGVRIAQSVQRRATGCTAGVRIQAEDSFLISPQCPGQLWAHIVSYPMGVLGDFSGVKQLGHETDHSPPYSAEVKNNGAIPPLSLRLHGTVFN